MKSFTLPKYAKGELWKISTTPMIVIHLNFQINEKDDKKKKAKTVKKKEGEPEKEDEDDENKINFFPKLEKCESFFNNALSMIVGSTNKVSNLEDDLMPFLKKEKQPNFPMTEEFEWVLDARDKMKQMFDENIVGPIDLLNKYKEYEYILNVDRKQLIKDLFGEEKAPLKELRERIQHYDTAYDKI